MLREWDASGLAQFIIATHSPILMSYPDAVLLSFDGGRIEPAQYTQTDHYRVTRRFLMDHESVLRQLFAEDDSDEQKDNASDD
jgi:predicted ATPase